MTRLGSVGLLVAITVPLMGNTCILAGLATAVTVAQAGHSFFQVGEDIVAATAVACQDVPVAKAASANLVRRGIRSVPGHMSLIAAVDGVCNAVTPSSLDVAAPAWVGQVVAKLEAPVP